MNIFNLRIQKNIDSERKLLLTNEWKIYPYEFMLEIEVWNRNINSKDIINIITNIIHK